MGAEALEAAVFNWAQKRGVDLAQLGVDLHADEKEEGRVVCKCFTLTEPYIRRKIKELKLRTIPEITNAIKKGAPAWPATTFPAACRTCSTKPPEMVEQLEKEIEIVQEFLPKALSAEETQKIVVQAIADSGAKTKKDLGLVMKGIMKINNTVDGKLAKELAEKLLND